MRPAGLSPAASIRILIHQRAHAYPIGSVASGDHTKEKPGMDHETLRMVLQGITSCAVAASLIFAAIQFYYARKAQHVANFTRLVELQFQLRKMRVDDPSL